MNRIGFIGMGHMGKALLDNILLSGTLNPEDIIIYNRTLSKAQDFKKNYPEIAIAECVKDLYGKVSIVISSVSAMAQRVFLEAIPQNKIHFISVSNGLTVSEMRKVYGGRITRIMPTVTMGGYTLLSNDSRDIDYLFTKISTPLFIKESDFDLFTLISSCGPGLFTALLEVILDKFSDRTDYDKKILTDIINKTFSSTLDGLISRKENYSELIERVATKDGLTQVGVDVIKDQFPTVIDGLIKKSLKYNRDKTSEILY